MKRKLFISLEDSTVKAIENHIEKGLFRNKSHLIEYSITKFIEDNQ